MNDAIKRLLDELAEPPDVTMTLNLSRKAPRNVKGASIETDWQPKADAIRERVYKAMKELSRYQYSLGFAVAQAEIDRQFGKDGEA